MKKSNLLLHERIYLYARCRRDVVKKRVGYHQFRETLNRIPVSPFIIAELSRFVSAKNRMLKKKRCRYKVLKPDGKIVFRTKRFPVALCELDDSIRVLSAEIAGIEKTFEANAFELQKKYDSHLMHKDFSLAKSNVRALHARRTALRKVKEEKYEQLVIMLSEKIRLIENLNAKIDLVKDWRFLRIRLYYSIITGMDVLFPPYYFTEKDLFLLCGNELCNEFTGVLAQAHEEFRRAKDSMTFRNEPSIKEII